MKKIIVGIMLVTTMLVSNLNILAVFSCNPVQEQMTTNWPGFDDD